MGSLAPGFRFHPTDEELVRYYLTRKVCGKSFHFDAISDIEIYKYEPWDLPGFSLLKSRDLEWYFFSVLDKKYGNGSRTNRATGQGHWKTTGKDRPVRRGDRTVGMKKTLVFHIGRPPRGERTNWVMHEYRLVDGELGQAGISLDAFVLCKIFQKSGSGPKNGEQYGAPFIEEEWEDDDALVPKGETREDAHCKEGGNGGDFQLQNDDEKKIELADPLVLGFPVGSDGGDVCNHLDIPSGFSGDDQKLIVDMGENEDMLKFLDKQKFFELPKQLQIDQPPSTNEYFELDDLLNPLDGGSHAVDPVVGELEYFDALCHDPPVVNGSFLEIDNLNPVDAVPSGFEMLDEYLKYFDALCHDPPVVNGSFLEIDDLNPVDAVPSDFEMLDEYLKYFDATDNNLNCVPPAFSSVSEDEGPILNQSSLTEEVTRGKGQAYLASLEPTKTLGDDGASSSKLKTEISKAAPDVQFHEGWGATLAKQASVMLGSISAPPAFAAELPTKELTFGQISTPSSSSIQVTSRMVHMSGMSISGTGKSWFFEKGGDADLLLPYGMKRDGVITVERLISNSTEPATNMLLSKGGTLMVRSGFYCVFLWVLVLSVSYKIGSFIYTG